MLKSVVMHDIDMDGIAAMERWYYRDHAPEINRRFGPWLPRHDSYLPVDAPADARQYGFYNWRVTEGSWRVLPNAGPAGNLAFTVPPQWPRVSTSFFPVQPTDDLFGGHWQPHQKNVLRWYCLMAYPAGVSATEGDDWFLQVHAPEVRASGIPYRMFSTRAHKEPVPLPGEWPADAHPPRESVLHHWDRLTEYWFESFADWRRFVAATSGMSRPQWATNAHFPYVECGKDFVSSFLLERPNDEFARDARGYL